MIKKIKSFFAKAKKSKIVVSRVRKVIDPTNYFGLNKIDIVKKACFEYDKVNQQFTANIIWKYLNGLLAIFDVYETMKELQQIGFLKKKTVLTSDYEKDKYKIFYALKYKLNEKFQSKI